MTTEEESIEEGEEFEFIDPNDILAELPDDGDMPMEEDEDGEERDDVGGLPSREESESMVGGFREHQGSVFAVSCHPTQPLAVSGGEDDLGYIWDITDGEIIVKLTGHTDTMMGEMVATGGMDGKVRIWRRHGNENYGTWEFLTELQGPDEIMWLRWHPKGTVLLAGSNDSTACLWQRKTYLACSRMNLMVNTSAIRKYHASFSGHTGPVQWNNIPGNQPFVDVGSSWRRVGGIRVGIGRSRSVISGGTDGRAYIWDLNTMRARATLNHGEETITTVLSHPTPRSHLVTTGSADGTLKTWDARS
ncbi:ribosome biogenesis protein Sqt1, partial [Pisolithus croceorrhizus]